jgi:GNAT superfamily N-acetyltransferase
MHKSEKSSIAEEVLRNLPEWFGIEEATKYYIDQVKEYPLFAIYETDLIGFYSVREENKDTLDMFVLGLKKKYHGQGYGKLLQEYVFDYAKKQGYLFCMVLTLSDAHPDQGYKKTREFYHKCGFKDIYESNKIWDESNPTQIMIKVL